MLNKYYAVIDAVLHESVFIRGLGDVGKVFPPHTSLSFDCKMYLVDGANMLIELKKVLGGGALGPLFTVLVPAPNVKHMILGAAVTSDEAKKSNGKSK